MSDALDVAIVGDDSPVPLLERPWVQQMWQADSGPAALRVLVTQTRQICERSYDLYAVLRSAEASEAGELLADNHLQRYTGLRAIAELLSQKPGFAAQLGIDEVADILYALAAEDGYGPLVVERGLADDEWQAWGIDALSKLLFPTSADNALRTSSRRSR